MQAVNTIMSPRVIDIHPDKLVCEVAGILDDKHISGAPLIDDDDRLVGVISKSDLNHFGFTGGNLFCTRVKEIASQNVITVDASTSVYEAARVMVDKNVHRLVVMENEKVIGMVSTFDFVKLAVGDNT